MLRLESPSLASGAPAVPARVSTPAADGAFPALFKDIQREVADFIAHGSDNAEEYAAAVDAGSLNADGQIYRAMLAPAAAPEKAGEAEDAAASNRKAFIASIAPLAREAGAKLGVSPDIITAHAALESGWGQRPLLRADGSSSNNLFGVKAGSAWRGEVARAATTEYEGGVAQARVEGFRSFPDQASAFRDFVRLMQDRYQGVINAGNDAGAYARALVRGGYATDPAYADKLVRVAAGIQSGE